MTATLNIEVQARTDQAMRNLGNLAKGAGGLASAFKDDAAGALGVFGVSLTATNQPLTLLADTLKQSVTAAANWGDEMGDLAQLTGQSVEETSKMAATFELMGIEGGQLTKVLKSLSEDGINLNMSSLKKLSREYQALQDPVEKNKFLFDHFGRAAADMAEIMGRSTDELDALSAAAARSGKVIGGDAADAAEQFNVNMAILQQRVEGAQISLGNALIPGLNKAVTAFDQLITIIQMGNVKLREQRGEIDTATAYMEMQRIAGIEPNTEATEDLTTATEDLTRSTSSLSAESERWAGMAEVAAQAAERKASIDRIATIDAQNYAQSQRDAVQALADLQAKQDGWASSTGQDVINALNDAGVEGREYEAALIAIDQQLGTSFANDAEKKKKLDDLTQSYADGKISVDDYKAGLNLLYSKDMPETAAAFEKARDKAGELDDKLVRMEGRRIQMYVDTIYRDIVESGPGIHNVATGDIKPVTPLNGGRAAGGPVEAGTAYVVGEDGPEIFVPDSAGSIIPNSQMSTYLGGVTVNVNGANMTNAGVGAAVRAELERMGRQADTRIRTR